MPITKATASSVAPAAKGDLVVGSATNDAAVLGVGSNDQVLTADSSTATGLKWAAVAAGSNWSLLNSGGTALSGTNVSITGISGKDKIMVLIKNASITTSGIAFGIRLNSDSGSNYIQMGNHSGGENSTTSSKIFVAYVPSSTASGGVTLTGCNSSGVKAFQVVGGAGSDGGYNLQGYYDSASTISSVQVYADGFTFGGGTVYVYASA